ncbi:MAG TPA: DUF1707 domain-containing protein [Trebonia sp.]|jgi:hypothetical protein|nr:DUF1707 domain-containing protein [Trebonia sp.]
MNPATDRLRTTLFGPGQPNPAMRVSDAERAEVADRLARHYGDGRLDKAEFDERVSRAMAAKTAGDFEGLFDDLPDLGGAPSDPPPGQAASTPPGPGMPPWAMGAPGYPARPRPRGFVRIALLAVLIIAVANVSFHALAWGIFPLGWFAVVALIIIVASRRRRHPRR